MTGRGWGHFSKVGGNRGPMKEMVPMKFPRPLLEGNRRFTVEPTHFRNNPRYGRTTTITDRNTGERMAFMGDLTKSQAIRNFFQVKDTRGGHR